MKLITTTLTLFLLCATIAYAQPAAPTIFENNYYQWTTWTEEEQVSYVLGFISGAYGLAMDVNEFLFIPGLWELLKERFPDQPIWVYIKAVNLAYEDPNMRNVPVWLVIFRMKEVSDMWKES